MPTYQYRCTQCAYEFEEFQSMSAPPLTECPRCKGKPERVISGGAGLLFKGDGFYITDYRSEGYKRDAKKDANKGESSSGTQSDKKPENKPDSKKSGD